jgi:hypothetical protein
MFDIWPKVGISIEPGAKLPKLQKFDPRDWTTTVAEKQRNAVGLPIQWFME